VIEPLDRRPPSLFRFLRPWLGLLVLATFALFMIALVVPGIATAATRWYLVGVAALATLATLRAIAARFPAYQRSKSGLFGQRQRVSDEQPQRLREIERLVAYSRWSGSDYDERLRPILYEIASQRLAAYRSVAVDTEPVTARSLLGENVWALIAPVQLSTPADRTITIAELEAVVTALEGIGATARH
jgi:hypothetical protein